MRSHAPNDSNLTLQHYLQDTKRNLADIRDLAIVHRDRTLLATTCPKQGSAEQLAQSRELLDIRLNRK